VYKKIETVLVKLDQEYKAENDLIQKNFNNLKEYIEVNLSLINIINIKRLKFQN